MGYLARRNRRVAAALYHEHVAWWRRIRVVLTYANKPIGRMPKALRGRRGWRWLLTGRRPSQEAWRH